MNRAAHKCDHCKKAFTPIKIDQKYCGHRCRQAAYRKRKVKEQKRKLADRRSIPAVCSYCQGTFWAKTERAVFCSTSCRTLYHRALKASLPHVLMNAYGMPEEKAYDIVETQPVGKLRTLLEASGYIYAHQARQWVRQPPDSSL